MNNVTLVGRLTTEPEIKESAEGVKRAVVTLAIARDHKNDEGIYEADFVKCVLWNGVAIATQNYCHKGDVIGIRGKIQTRKYETNDNKTTYITEVVADKISFLSSTSKGEEKPLKE